LSKTVLIADDHGLVRAGLRMIVEQIDSFVVVGEAADGREAIAQARRFRPDVVLIDLTMPLLNGIEAIPQLLRHLPETRVIVLSMHTTEQHVAAALRAGAVGYVVKDAAVDELADALGAAVDGGFFVSRQVAAHVRTAFVSPPPSTDGAPADTAIARLTQRQREVLQLIAEGHSTRDIAQLLFISIKTVETHRAEIMRRLDVWDVAGLTRLAIRTGLVSPER
jgi:DNA-binding NarL/FixJ family response regulator